MEKIRKLAYAGWIVVPAFCFSAGCGGDPPPTPVEVEDVTVEDLEEGATTGVELGTETDSPIDETEGGAAAESSEADAAPIE